MSKEESLRFQFGTLKNGRGQHSKYLPYAFTEQGVAMLSGVLHSEIAVNTSIEIMRAFIYMRRYMLENSGVVERLTNEEYILFQSRNVYLRRNLGSLRNLISGA